MVQRFYFPLTVHTYKRGAWEATEGDGRIACKYRGEIENALDVYNAGEDMSQYFHGSETAKAKIVGAEWRFEAVDGCLFGRVDVFLSESLNDVETENVKSWICGQNSDGLGEGFEQQSIRVEYDIIEVSFWNPSDDYRIMTEEEFRNR